MPPQVSIVVPSYNQVSYLTECLDSILAQPIEDVEVLVLDGGSTDGSRQLLERYSRRLAFWRSETDAGQASAINEGFRRATGQIFGWLNSDDLYLPGALVEVVHRLAGRLEQPVVLYGGCEHFSQTTRHVHRRPALPFLPERLRIVDFIDQPSTFWTRRAWELSGELDSALVYTLDWDWLIRASGNCEFIRSDKMLSRYRWHGEHKTSTGGRERWDEIWRLMERYGSEEIRLHYDFLRSHPLTQFWLNKRMRLAQWTGALFGTRLGAGLADFASPPFWFLPRRLRRETFWMISGIR